MWFHLKDLPSSHIIAALPEKASREAVKAVIAHGQRLSKELSKHGNKVTVMHARVRQVQKTDVEGQVMVTGK